MEVADVGRGGAGVGEEVDDADQFAVQFGAQGVDSGGRLEVGPGTVVEAGRHGGAAVESVVALEELFPGGAVGGLQRGNDDHFVTIAVPPIR